MRRAVAALLVATTATGIAAQEANWRRVATPADRERIRQWRNAWMAALPVARDGGGESSVAGDAALFDPDHATDEALPPAGSYRCRTVRMGRMGAGSAFQATNPVPCQVSKGGRGFAVEGGAARLNGVFYPETASRAVFLGTVMLPDERRPMTYGRDARRDSAGLVERIGPARWRLVLPYPRFGSVLDVVEIVPAG